MESTEQSAGLIFSGAGVLTGITLLLIASTWKSLKEYLLALPKRRRKIRFNLKGIRSKKMKWSEQLKSSLYIGLLFFGVTVALNAFVFLAVTGTMAGWFDADNIEWGRWTLVLSVVTFWTGIASIGWFRLSEFLDLKSGRLVT